MSGPIRRERRSPVPCWSPNDDVAAQELTADPARTEHADWLLLLPIAPGAAALDLGCGRGALSLDLAQYYDRVTAVDPEWECVSATQVAAARAGLPNIRATLADPQTLVASGRRFDLVVVRDARRLFAGMRAARAVEMLTRLTRPNGCIAIAAGAPPETPQGELHPGRASSGHRSPRVPYWGDFGAANLSRVLGRAGFPGVQILAAVPDAHAADCLFPVGGRMLPVPPGRVVSRCLWPVSGWREGLLRVAASLSLWTAARVLVPGFWVIARAPGSLRAVAAEEMVRSIVARPSLQNLRRTDPPERARTALRARMLNFVVSREHAGPEEWSAVAALPVGWREPACVLRVQRQRSGESRVGEAQMDLVRLRARLSSRLRESVPAPLGAAEVGDHHAAAEAYLGGQPLHRVIQGAGRHGERRVVERVLPALAHWLAELHEQTCTRAWLEGPDAAEWMRRSLGSRLPNAGRLCGLDPLDGVVEGIARAGTRLGAAHCQLEPHRVLVRPEGIAVTGWDRVSFEELPLLDLLTLAGALGKLLLPARDRSDAAAFGFTFGEETWYREQVRSAVAAYCERIGIASDAVGLYLAYGLIRAALADPVAHVGWGVGDSPLVGLALQSQWMW